MVDALLVLGIATGFGIAFTLLLVIAARARKFYEEIGMPLCSDSTRREED